jgi:hypothetical protein
MAKATLAESAETIRRLKERANRAERLVLQLLPDKASDILNGYLRCETEKDVDIWLSEATTELVALAEYKPAEEMNSLGHSTFRAYCPLCGRGTVYAYASGFAWPRGLEDHLFGGSTARHCDVMRLIRERALDHVALSAERRKHRSAG